MSSSRRSSHSERRRRAAHCPSCGSSQVITTDEDVVFRVCGRNHRFKHVPHERCLACGERIFSIDVSRQLDAVVLKGRKRAA